MTKQIKAYRAAWNTRPNQGLIDVQATDDSTQRFRFENPAEFTAVLTILESSQTAFFNGEGSVFTGPELIRE